MRIKIPRARVNITLTKTTLEEIETIALERGSSTSAVLEQLAREELRRRADSQREPTPQTPQKGRR